MSTSTLTSKGQITLPKEVRAHLGVAEGDRLDFIIGVDGSVRGGPGDFADYLIGWQNGTRRAARGL